MRIPERLDLSRLDFLQYGDMTKIVNEERSNGRKTRLSYVSRVLKGKHRNDRILRRAFEIALENEGKFPKQAIKSI